MTGTKDMPNNAEQPTRSTHILIHAGPARQSFGHAIVDTYVETVRALGQDVVVRDLYAMKFDPVLQAGERPGEDGWEPAPDVARELDLVASADQVVLVYPIWFGLPPAILKGYVDRVLGANYSYRAFSTRAGQPILAGKPLLSFSTSGTSLSWLNAQNQPFSLREIFDVYLWQGFGMKQSEHVAIDSVVPAMSEGYAKTQLQRVRDAAVRACGALADTYVASTVFEA